VKLTEKQEAAKKNVKWWDETCKRHEGKEIAGFKVNRFASYVEFFHTDSSGKSYFSFNDATFQENVKEEFRKLFQKAGKGRDE